MNTYNCIQNANCYLDEGVTSEDYICKDQSQYGGCPGTFPSAAACASLCDHTTGCNMYQFADNTAAKEKNTCFLFTGATENPPDCREELHNQVAGVSTTLKKPLGSIPGPCKVTA